MPETESKDLKTTIIGVLTAIGVVVTQLLALLDGDPSTAFDLGILIGALGIGGLSFFAKDK